MPTPNEKILHVLTGPTAVGKTDVALRWAERQKAEIISCDSLLFYRGMDIGTAKPTLEDQSRVSHHLIDHCDVTERMDIKQYVELATRTAQEILARNRKVLVTGGSGFYLRTFFAPVADDVPVSAELRAEIAAQLESGGISALVADLERRNPGGLGNLDTANSRRVLRALERCRASGRTLSDLAAEFAGKPAPFAEWTVKLARLERAPGELENRIKLRVEMMLAQGLVAEVERLLVRGLRKNPSAAKAIGYRETISMLEGSLPASNLARTIIQNTKALVKKQRTWFRTQLPVHSLIPADGALLEDLFRSIHDAP